MNSSGTVRVLLIEDEEGLVITLRDRLRSEGYDVEVARDGVEGLHRGSTDTFDLILLDLMLPERDGFEVCRELRRRRVETPILILTARDRVDDKIRGLKLGADDYLTKPFEPGELTARCEAILRRTAGRSTEAEESLSLGTSTVDLRRAEIVADDGSVTGLSATELGLLRYFCRNPGAAISRDELLSRVWGYDTEVSTRTVDVHVASLRKKIEPDPHNPSLLLTVHGIGYRLAVSVGDESRRSDSSLGSGLVTDPKRE